MSVMFAAGIAVPDPVGKEMGTVAVPEMVGFPPIPSPFAIEIPVPAVRVLPSKSPFPSAARIPVWMIFKLFCIATCYLLLNDSPARLGT